MSSEVSKLKERVTRLERWRRRVSEELAILPETIDPLGKQWKHFDVLDRDILELLLSDTPYSTVEIGNKLRVHRTKVWRRMKKIKRVSEKIKGNSIIVFNPSTKQWSLNTEEFEFKGLETKQ